MEKKQNLRSNQLVSAKVLATDSRKSNQGEFEAAHRFVETFAYAESERYDSLSFYRFIWQAITT